MGKAGNFRRLWAFRARKKPLDDRVMPEQYAFSLENTPREYEIIWGL